MKTFLILCGTAFVLAVTGCAGGYGGAYAGVSGEYPSTYYGGNYYGGNYYSPGYAYPYPYVVRPYDRDHYWDRHRYWERHRWHADEHYPH